MPLSLKNRNAGKKHFYRFLSSLGFFANMPDLIASAIFMIIYQSFNAHLEQRWVN